MLINLYKWTNDDPLVDTVSRFPKKEKNNKTQNTGPFSLLEKLRGGGARNDKMSFRTKFLISASTPSLNNAEESKRLLILGKAKHKGKHLKRYVNVGIHYSQPKN